MPSVQQKVLLNTKEMGSLTEQILKSRTACALLAVSGSQESQNNARNTLRLSVLQCERADTLNGLVDRLGGPARLLMHPDFSQWAEHSLLSLVECDNEQLHQCIEQGLEESKHADQY